MPGHSPAGRKRGPRSADGPRGADRRDGEISIRDGIVLARTQVAGLRRFAGHDGLGGPGVSHGRVFRRTGIDAHVGRKPAIARGWWTDGRCPRAGGRSRGEVEVAFGRVQEGGVARDAMGIKPGGRAPIRQGTDGTGCVVENRRLAHDKVVVGIGQQDLPTGSLDVAAVE